jgi:hypothetical protein
LCTYQIQELTDTTNIEQTLAHNMPAHYFRKDATNEPSGVPTPHFEEPESLDGDAGPSGMYIHSTFPQMGLSSLSPDPRADATLSASAMLALDSDHATRPASPKGGNAQPFSSDRELPGPSQPSKPLGKSKAASKTTPGEMHHTC